MQFVWFYWGFRGRQRFCVQHPFKTIFPPRWPIKLVEKSTLTGSNNLTTWALNFSDFLCQLLQHHNKIKSIGHVNICRIPGLEIRLTLSGTFLLTWPSQNIIWDFLFTVRWSQCSYWGVCQISHCELDALLGVKSETIVFLFFWVQNSFRENRLDFILIFLRIYFEKNTIYANLYSIWNDLILFWDLV